MQFVGEGQHILCCQLFFTLGINDLGQRLHHSQSRNEWIPCLLLHFQRFLLFGLSVCVCACLCGWLVLSCQPLGTQEMEMNHGRQIKRMARAHDILLKTGDDLRQGLSLSSTLPFLPHCFSLFLSILLLPLSISSLTHSSLLSPFSFAVCCSQTVVWHGASDQWLGLKRPIKISVTHCICVWGSEYEVERQGVTRWWMIYDGCDLNRWLWAGQMISSEVIRRRHRITARSLSVYGSLTATAEQIAQQL